ncbi:MAG: primosomal protein N' [Candidatus Kerfeldbacteria bacterium]|nr:primosomal protein N' [Candidatus Kerfeldbacteria bacterium]
MIAEIIPHLRLVRSLGRFDYRIPQELERECVEGAFVVLPWRGRTIPGVVAAIKSRSSVPRAKLKEIARVLHALPPLTAENRLLLQWFSRVYGISPALALKTFVPFIPLRPSAYGEPAHVRAAPLRLSRVQLSTLEKLTQEWATHRRTAIRFPNQPLMLAWYHVVAKHLNKNDQLLILVPEIDDIFLIQSSLPAFLLRRVAVVTSGQSKNEYAQIRRRVASGEASIILGTKFSIFLPFKRLKHIIVHDESSASHPQSDINPRYDPRRVARELARLTPATLTVLGPSLSLKSEYAIQQKEYVDLSPAEPPRVEMRTLPFHPQELESPITNVLREYIEASLLRKEKVFCFLDKKGFSSFVECADCHTLFRCPTCSFVMPVAKRTNALWLECHRCGIVLPMPENCPNCSGARLRTRGWGLGRVEEALAELFPEARLQRIDSDTRSLPSAATDIFLGTEYALRRLSWRDIRTVGIIHMNGLLQLPTFESLERVWNVLSRIRFYLGPQTHKSTMLLQTIDDIPAFLTSLDRKAYLESELESRKLFAYPPFGRIVVFRKSLRDGNSIEQETSAFVPLLTRLYPDAKSISDVLVNTVGGKTTIRIVVKFPQDASLSFDRIPDDWLIDVDATSLLH